tara:strand:- start:886 stop:1248 length:363 start_codon:yes stop_codon:yes gene_type:complete
MMPKKTIDIGNISSKQANVIILEILSLIKDFGQIEYINWPYEDLSVDDIFRYLKMMYYDEFLKNDFIKHFINELNKKKQYSTIEGFFSLIKYFEHEERYEDCLLLKNIKDHLLYDMESSH